MLNLTNYLRRCGATPLLLWGAPGVGKTARVVQAARDLDLPLETVIASVRDPTDFAGLPVPVPGDGIRLEPPAWAVRLHRAGKGILFLDELSCAPPAVQAALLRVVHERTVGDLQLPADVRVVAAANPPDESAGGFDLPDPAANRWRHETVPAPSAGEWCEWLMGAEARGLRADAWDRARALVSGFLRARPGGIFEDAKTRAGRFPLAFATPRSWEAATRDLAAAIEDGTQDDLLPIFAGHIGEPIGVEAAAWIRSADLPDPEGLLADPKSYDFDKARPDRTFAVLTAVVVTACRKEGIAPAARVKRWCSAWEILDRAKVAGRDVCACAARTLCRPENRQSEGLKRPNILAFIKDFAAICKDAGIL